MSLEKTVLNEALIKKLLYNNYNIAVISITKTNLGSANCYIVSNADNKYFLKEF